MLAGIKEAVDSDGHVQETGPAYVGGRHHVGSVDGCSAPTETMTLRPETFFLNYSDVRPARSRPPPLGIRLPSAPLPWSWTEFCPSHCPASFDRINLYKSPQKLKVGYHGRERLSPRRPDATCVARSAVYLVHTMQVHGGGEGLRGSDLCPRRAKSRVCCRSILPGTHGCQGWLPSPNLTPVNPPETVDALLLLS